MIKIVTEVEGGPPVVVIAPNPIEAAGAVAPFPKDGVKELQSRVRCICLMPDGRRFDEVLVISKKRERDLVLGANQQLLREASTKVLSSVPFDKIENWQGLDEVEHYAHRLGVAAVKARAAGLDLPPSRIKAEWKEEEAEGRFTMTLTLLTTAEVKDGPA